MDIRQRLEEEAKRQNMSLHDFIDCRLLHSQLGSDILRQIAEEVSVDVKSAAKKLEISISLLYRIIAEKRIEHRRIGGRNRRGKIVIDDEAVQAFKEECICELSDD